MGRYGGEFESRPSDSDDDDKMARAAAFFREDCAEIEVIPAAREEKYRQRSRFSVTGFGSTEGLHYNNAWKGRGTFLLASERVEAIAVGVMAFCRADPAVGGCAPLHAVHVHAAQSAAAEPVVTLLYGPPGIVDVEAWLAGARAMRETLPGVVHVVGRSKGKTIVCDRNHIVETLRLADGRELTYEQPEGSFSHPVARANEQTLNWLCQRAAELNKGNLLELYCGGGNHTVALAPYFERIVAVEIDAKLTAAAKRNLARNNEEGEVVTSQSGAACARILRHRQWRLPGDAGEISFDAVLVDPPRCGLDVKTLALLPRYPNVLYVSCNPLALKNDLKELLKTHDLVALALLDAFPGTPHLECLAHLRIKQETAAVTTSSSSSSSSSRTIPPFAPLSCCLFSGNCTLS